MLSSVFNLKTLLFFGAVGMFICTAFRRKRFSINLFQCAVFTLLLTATGVAGAKLLFAVENGLRAWDGVSFFGSVFLIPIIMPLAGSLFHLKPRQTMDICAPCVAIMIACLRINCFVSGCCGGWAVCIGNICFAWPTQMLDSVGDVLIMSWLLKQEENDNHVGKLYPWFMVLYSSMRFFLEFLRDTPKDWMMFSHGQWFSFMAILIGAVWLSCAKRRSSAI